VYLFDGMQLFTCQKMDKKKTYNTVRTGQSAGVQQQVIVSFSAEVAPNSPTALQLFNLIFKQILGMVGFSQVQRHYFNPNLKHVLDRHKLEVWPGFITSILQYETNVMLMTEVSHKVLRTDTVLDIFYDLMRRHSGPAFYEEAKKNVIGQIVLTKYNNKTYRIDDVLFNKSPQDTFDYKGDKITFIDYYKKEHNVEIKDKRQPILVNKPKYKAGQQLKKWQLENIWLIPELCSMTGLTDQNRANFSLMKDLAVHTRLGPEQRVEKIRALLQNIRRSTEASQRLQGWGISFADQLLQLNGRVLPQERITMHGRELEYKAVECDWSRGQRSCMMNIPMALENWLFLYAASDREGERLKDEFMSCMRRVCQPMGMNLRPPQIVSLESDRTDQYTQAINRHVTPNTQMVICLLPNNRKDRYDAIKKLCCVDRAVPSQCMLNRSLSKNAMSVVTKIAVQLNCKLGGDVWSVDMPLKNVMICGFDTYHDSGPKKDGRKQSVGAFLASFNKTCSQYYSNIALHTNREEVSNYISLSFTTCVRKYVEKNGAMPDRVVFYRDGVGDGDLEHVYDFEVKALENAIETMNQKVKLTVIVVKKRISTRFFLMDQRGNASNPAPGTMVDTEVTRPEWYDFFLVSQSVRQGTVTPTHFNIIKDDSGLKPDHLQRLTYKMCHLYFNWPGTVRVPAPCQYAHKLAYLVGTSIHKSPDPRLCDSLFFL
jgi:aubergine-like protein